METIIKYAVYLLFAKYGLNFIMFVWRMLRLYMLPNFGFCLNLKKYGSWAGLIFIIHFIIPTVRI